GQDRCPRVPEGEQANREGRVKRFDAVVIGAGHNGLVTAAYLSKAGKSVLILERAATTGGILRGPELAPGFTAPGLAHTVGRLRASVIKDVEPKQSGLALISSG